MNLFDAHLMVDWSAASRANPGPDSIWAAAITRSGTRWLENLPTRARAKAAILERLEQFVDQELRVLVGFDFPHWLSRWVRVNRR